MGDLQCEHGWSLRQRTEPCPDCEEETSPLIEAADELAAALIEIDSFLAFEATEVRDPSPGNDEFQDAITRVRDALETYRAVRGGEGG